MEKHSIHLGTAWEPPAGAGPPAPADGAADGAGNGAADGVWIRRFGRPAGLEPVDRVLLVCEQPAAGAFRAELTLNGMPLPALGPAMPRWQHDITPLLRDHNELFLVPLGAAAMRLSAGSENQRRTALPSAWCRVSVEIVSASD